MFFHRTNLTLHLTDASVQFNASVLYADRFTRKIKNREAPQSRTCRFRESILSAAAKRRYGRRIRLTRDEARVEALVGRSPRFPVARSCITMAAVWILHRLLSVHRRRLECYRPHQHGLAGGTVAAKQQRRDRARSRGALRPAPNLAQPPKAKRLMLLLTKLLWYLAPILDSWLFSGPTERESVKYEAAGFRSSTLSASEVKASKRRQSSRSRHSRPGIEVSLEPLPEIAVDLGSCPDRTSKQLWTRAIKSGISFGRFFVVNS